MDIGRNKYNDMIMNRNFIYKVFFPKQNLRKEYNDNWKTNTMTWKQEETNTMRYDNG